MAKEPRKPRKKPTRQPAQPERDDQLADAVDATADGGRVDDSRGRPYPTSVHVDGPIDVNVNPPGPGAGPVPVAVQQPDPVPVRATLTRTESVPTQDQALWAAIRNRTLAIGFNRYQQFIDRVLCHDDLDTDFNNSDVEPGLQKELSAAKDRIKSARGLHGVDAYEVLKTATEVFLLLQCGVAIEPRKNEQDDPECEETYPGLEPERFGGTVDKCKILDDLERYLQLDRRTLPYLQRIVDNLSLEVQDGNSPFCDGIPEARLTRPCLLELIWSYWHEEGMLVQSVNAISLRFQNKRASGAPDPLAQLELDPLRPLSHLVWGYIQDEQHRLSVPRRTYEYEHHYGLTLLGKAVPKLRPADRRSKFLEAFHTLLNRASIFFQEDSDTTVIADGFPLLKVLKEVHMLLAEGAHNQFRDLPWTARVEMMLQQWLLSRREVRDFLRGRYMVPYQEGWMAQVDALKKLKGWSDTSVSHFRDLGVHGEQILLSVRYGDWTDVTGEASAKNWARYWKPEIQSYIHAYRAATGIDLSSADGLDFTPPAIHLRHRLARQAKAS